MRQDPCLVRPRPIDRRRVLCLGVLVFLAGCSLPLGTADRETPLPELPFGQELQLALDRALQSAQGDYDLGISAAVIVPGYAPWSGVSGNSHRGVPVTPDMLFDAGSVAKNFEAALILKMAEAGQLDLDDPLSCWLPSYRHVDGAVTVRQLLNHTSGVFNVFEHPEFPWVGSQVDYAKAWPMEDVCDTFVLEPYGPPGHVQHYSSTNYLLATAILQDGLGVRIPDEIERLFLQPLALEHTVMSTGEPIPARFALAHPWVDVDQDGDLDDKVGAPFTWKVTLTHPVLYTTPTDLARWINALYHEDAVLEADSLVEMLTFPETLVQDPEGGRYGLGVVDYSDVLGMPAIGHGGSSLGYSAAALYLPEYGVSVAWLSNTGESPQRLASAIMSATWTYLSEVLGQQLKPAP